MQLGWTDFAIFFILPIMSFMRYTYYVVQSNCAETLNIETTYPRRSGNLSTVDYTKLIGQRTNVRPLRFSHHDMKLCFCFVKKKTATLVYHTPKWPTCESSPSLSIHTSASPVTTLLGLQVGFVSDLKATCALCHICAVYRLAIKCQLYALR